MTIRDIKGEVMDLIPVRNVIVSVFDKTGLDTFIPALVKASPDVRFLSTGGTYKALERILANVQIPTSLLEVAEYTEFPEMEGGLVKTLHPKIHAGILGERGNPEHQRYLKQILNRGDYIDMVVVNLYPFDEVVRKIRDGEIDTKTSKPYNFESARGNIDIGGPTMIRAAAKNFPGCAVVCNPNNYSDVLNTIKKNNGATSFNQRFELAEEVFSAMEKYDGAISAYWREQFGGLNCQEIRKLYKFSGGSEDGSHS